MKTVERKHGSIVGCDSHGTSSSVHSTFSSKSYASQHFNTILNPLKRMALYRVCSRSGSPVISLSFGFIRLVVNHVRSCFWSWYVEHSGFSSSLHRNTQPHQSISSNCSGELMFYSQIALKQFSSISTLFITTSTRHIDLSSA